MKALGLLLLMCSVASAQITIPAQNDPYTIIAAKLTAAIPSGAQIQGGWSAPTADLIQGCLPTEAYLTGPPGSHLVSFRGAWLQTREIVLEGEKVQILQGFGFLDFEQEFAIGDSPGPKPKPKPDPTPLDQRWALIVEETSERTPAQGNLWVLLRKSFGLSSLLIVDKDSQADSLSAPLLAVRESGLKLPVLVVLDKQDKIIRVAECPTTLQGVEEEIKK